MPNPDRSVRHDRDSTVSQCLLKNEDVLYKHPRLNRRSGITHAKQNHRRQRSAGTRQQRAEVGILRDDHAAFLGSPVKDNVVAGGAQAELADVQCLMSGGLQRLAHDPGNGLVEQESQVTNQSGPTG